MQSKTTNRTPYLNATAIWSCLRSVLFTLMLKGMTEIAKTAGMRTHKTRPQDKSEKITLTFPEENKTKQNKNGRLILCVNWRDLIMLSVDAVFKSFVMPFRRRHWQLSCVNVSCCSAVQASVGSVIDVSLCCVQCWRCDFFSGCKESPINQLWKPGQWLSILCFLADQSRRPDIFRVRSTYALLHLRWQLSQT